MAAESSDYLVRRERLALRARITQLADSAIGGLPSTNVGLSSTNGRDASSITDIEIAGFAAALVDDTLYVSANPIQQDARVTALGATVTWLTRHGSSHLRSVVLIDESTAGLTARRATHVNLPIVVVNARNGDLTLALPEPHLPNVEASPSHLSVAEMFQAAGAEVVVEHGVVAAEVVGLEVARVVDEDGVAMARIGIGLHDRDMYQLVHGKTATIEQLREVVRLVGKYRSDGTTQHPISNLAPERALRYRALKEPGRIGLSTLQIAEPPLPRANVKDSVPCCALGRTAEGRDAVVVFTSGVDLDAVAFAADARNRLAPDATLLIATESRNVVPVQQRLAELLHQPAHFVAA